MNELPARQDESHNEYDEDENKLWSIHSMQKLGKAPKVNVLVKGYNGSAQLSVLPDSGADISAADETILVKLGENVDNLLPSNQKAYSVDGSSL